jgi:hypothetical protein
MALPTTIGQARNGNLTAMKAQILQIDPTTAGPTELVNQASLMALYGRIQDSLFIDLGDPTSLGDISSGDLSSFLSNINSLADFNARLSDQTWCNLLTGNVGAMATVSGSVTAVTALIAAPKALTAALASNVAMTALMASNVSVSVFVGSSSAMSSLAASVTASNAMVASVTMMNAVATSAVSRTAIGNGSVQNAGFTAIAASSMALAKYAIGQAANASGVTDPSAYADLTAVTALSSSQHTTFATSYSAIYTVLSNSAVGMAALVASVGFITYAGSLSVANSVNNAMTASQYKVGAYLDKIRTQIGGVGSNANLAAANTVAQISALAAADLTALFSVTQARLNVLISVSAMTTLAASANAMAVLTANSSYMTTVWSVVSAATIMFQNTASRQAMWTNDLASLATLQANPATVQALISANVFSKFISTTIPQKMTATGVKTILIRRFYGTNAGASGDEYEYISYKKTGDGVTTGVGNGVFSPDGTRGLAPGNLSTGTVAGVYTSNGVRPITDDTSANFVAAANGLERTSWAYGQNMTVYYIAA